jgi:hypothetical protein
MCRSIRPLFNTEPATTDDEVRAAARQFVRKISGYRTPSEANTRAFEAAVDDVTAASARLLATLRTPSSRKRKVVPKRRPASVPEAATPA